MDTTTDQPNSGTTSVHRRTTRARAFQPPRRTDSFPAPHWWIDRARSLLLIAPTSFVLGMLTSLGQSELPDWISSITNSSGGWSAAVFGLVWCSRSRPLLAVIGGPISFGLLNAGYAVMSSIRGFTWSLDLGNLFVLLGFVIGPVIGLAAAWMRSQSVWLVAIAAAALPTILLGEGVYGLTRISDSTSPVYWWLSIIAGVAFLAVIGMLRLRSAVPIGLSVMLSAAGAIAFPIAYSVA